MPWAFLLNALIGKVATSALPAGLFRLFLRLCTRLEPGRRVGSRLIRGFGRILEETWHVRNRNAGGVPDDQGVCFDFGHGPTDRLRCCSDDIGQQLAIDRKCELGILRHMLPRCFQEVTEGDHETRFDVGRQARDVALQGRFHPSGKVRGHELGDLMIFRVETAKIVFSDEDDATAGQGSG